MNAKKISIVVPVYNTENYLGNCITSVLNQTYKNFELILINDGSTDNSREICNNFASKDLRVKVFNQNNLGVSAARNLGLQVSMGQYILFLDSDDELNNKCLELLLSIQENKEFDWIMFSYVRDNEILNAKTKIIFNDTELSTKCEFQNLLHHFVEKEHINTLWNKMYKREIIELHNLRFNEEFSIGEDLLFNFEYSKFIKSYKVISNELYIYKIRDNDSLSQKYDENKLVNLQKINDLMRLNQGSEQNLIKSINFIRVKNLYSSMFSIYSNKTLDRNEKINLLNSIINLNNFDKSYRKLKLKHIPLIIPFYVKSPYFTYFFIKIISIIYK